MNKTTLVYIAMLGATIFWGFSFIWTIQVFEVYGPITTVFLRLVLSSVLLFSIGAVLGKLQKVKLTDIRTIVIMAFFQPFLYFIGETVSLTYVSPTVASVIIATIPLFSPIAAYWFLREKVSLMNFIGILISVAGVFFVIVDSGFVPNVSLTGIGLLLFAVMAAIGYSVIVVKLASKYNVYTLIAWQNFLGILMFLPIFYFTEFDSFIAAKPSVTQLLPLLYLAVFASSGAFMLFTYGIRNLGVVKANTLTNGIPVFTAFFSWWLLSEKLNWINIVGIVIVLGGLLLSQVKKESVKAVLLRKNRF